MTYTVDEKILTTESRVMHVVILVQLPIVLARGETILGQEGRKLRSY